MLSCSVVTVSVLEDSVGYGSDNVGALGRSVCVVENVVELAFVLPVQVCTAMAESALNDSHMVGFGPSDQRSCRAGA